MARLSLRLVVYVGSLLFLTTCYTVAYRWGMGTLENDPRTWIGALEVVVQSLTTTGYGQDAPWETLEMTALMVVIQLTGIAYIFVAFPVFVVPWLERIVQPTPPERVDDLEEHIVIVGYTDLCASLVESLASNETTPYVVLEADEERAGDLHEMGISVIYSDPTDEAGLEAARVDDATAVVVDATDREFVSTILAIGGRDSDVEILALVTDPSRARYLRYAGADDVLSPKHRLGKAIGDKVRDVVSLSSEQLAFGTDLHVVEHSIDAGSEFFGRPLAAAGEIERTGASVLGAWIGGDFLRTLPSDVTADEFTTLVVVGTEDEVDAVAELVGTNGHQYHPEPEPVVVAGGGIVGAAVIGSLERAGLETSLIALEAGAFVDTEPDVVGDVTTEATLEEADIGDARTLVLALEDDADAMVATLVARQLNPNLEILVAASKDASVRRLRAAGANYVLSLPNVAGRMVLLDLFEGDVMVLGDRLHLVREPAPALVDDPIDPESIRAAVGSAVVALEREGEVLTDVDGRTLERGDHLVLAGTEAELERFREAFGAD